MLLVIGNILLFVAICRDGQEFGLDQTWWDVNWIRKDVNDGSVSSLISDFFVILNCLGISKLTRRWQKRLWRN